MRPPRRWQSNSLTRTDRFTPLERVSAGADSRARNPTGSMCHLACFGNVRACVRPIRFVKYQTEPTVGSRTNACAATIAAGHSHPLTKARKHANVPLRLRGTAGLAHGCGGAADLAGRRLAHPPSGQGARGRPRDGRTRNGGFSQSTPRCHARCGAKEAFDRLPGARDRQPDHGGTGIVDAFDDGRQAGGRKARHGIDQQFRYVVVLLQISFRPFFCRQR